ncbi:M1 family metallopeptidase [uncultured Jatrophihabitans sp.]|uniref:M1 family metallopeptidase n=1 Tax=uncultured Jatrophihabitans sp. TaxID=1610747 RepID=UPI0035CBB557
MPLRLRRTAGVVAVTVALVAPLAGPTAVAGAATHFTHGAAGVGDPYFPLEGNGGYNVGHYTLDLHYLPSSHYLSGVAHITARATQNLSRFDLDLSGMHVRSIVVNGAHARWHRRGQELQITPRHGLRRGHRFHAAVSYAGSPRTITGSPVVFGADYGWQYTPDGAFVGDEPNAAHTWFPSDDHPSDKATYTFHITVPRGRQVVANGNLQHHRTTRHSSVWTWHETSPMATYLATIDIGKWKFRFGHTPGGIRETMAVDPHLAKQASSDKVFALTGAITDYWSKTFGRYPFTSTGAIVDNVPDVGFSLETQTRPLYGFSPDPTTMSHELSHQWFGDSVSVATWRNIWLNEGFATFAEQLWAEHTGGPSTYSYFSQLFAKIPASDGFWHQAIADPKRNTMFSSAVYSRGGMTLAALRHRIGDAKFFTLLRTWTAQHRYSVATTAQFVTLAQKVSGQNLTTFFRIWLSTQSKPTSFNAG